MLVAALTGDRAGCARGLANPYKGLQAFDEADAADFFGRADLVDEILARLGRDDLRGRLVLVVGGSGTGKSSVVRAGLLPRIRRGDVPGSRAVVRHDDAARVLAVQGAGREPAARRRRRRRPGWPSSSPSERRHRSGAAPARARRRPAAAGRRPVRGAVHPGRRAGPASVPRRPGARRHRPRQPPAGGGDPARRLLRPPARRPTVRLRRQRGDGDDRRDVARRAGGRVVEPAERVGGARRAGAGRRAGQRRRRRTRGAPVAAVHAVRAGRAESGQAAHARRVPRARRGRRGDRLACRAALPRPRRRRAGGGAADVRAARRRRRRGRAHPAARRPAPSWPALARTCRWTRSIDRWAQARLLTLDRHPQTRVPTVELAHEALLREWPRLRDWIAEDREAIDGARPAARGGGDAGSSSTAIRARCTAAPASRSPSTSPAVAPATCRRSSGSSSTPAARSATASSATRRRASPARRGPTGGCGSNSPSSPSPSSSPSSAASSPSTSGGDAAAGAPGGDGPRAGRGGRREHRRRPRTQHAARPGSRSTRRGPATARCCPRPRQPCTAPCPRHASCSACPVSVAGSTGAPTGRSSSPKARRSRGLVDIRDADDRRVAALVPGSRHRRQRRRLQQRRVDARHRR